MFEKVISRHRKTLLELLVRKDILRNFYLAGGTAAALQLGHRLSEDFDFFTQDEFDTFDMIQNLGQLGTFTPTGESRGTLHGILKETKLTFLKYKYPLLYPTKSFCGCQVADLKDIALMKMTAISSRGSKKDFIDLFLITKEIISLSSLLDLFDKKYKNVNYSKYHLIKSIGYFEDADREVQPVMLKSINWENIKEYFLQQQKELLKSFERTFTENRTK